VSPAITVLRRSSRANPLFSFTRQFARSSTIASNRRHFMVQGAGAYNLHAGVGVARFGPGCVDTRILWRFRPVSGGRTKTNNKMKAEGAGLRDR
jgi:hypothetical protein